MIYFNKILPVIFSPLGLLIFLLIYGILRKIEDFAMTEQQIQEIMKDELLMEIIEEEAAKYEITVDYYIQEFAL